MTPAKGLSGCSILTLCRQDLFGSRYSIFKSTIISFLISLSNVITENWLPIIKHRFDTLFFSLHTLFCALYYHIIFIFFFYQNHILIEENGLCINIFFLNNQYQLDFHTSLYSVSPFYISFLDIFSTPSWIGKREREREKETMAHYVYSLFFYSTFFVFIAFFIRPVE